MSGKVTLETSIPLEGTKNGVISISQIEEPYGPKSGTVASIGISLAGKADAPEWKVHLPLDSHLFHITLFVPFSK
jgi:hypothetical protein